MTTQGLPGTSPRRHPRPRYLWMVSSSSLVFTSSSCICFFIASSSSEAEDGAPSSSHLSRRALDWGARGGGGGHGPVTPGAGGSRPSLEQRRGPRGGGPHLEVLQLPPVILELPPLVLDLRLAFPLLLRGWDSGTAGVSLGQGQQRARLAGGRLHPGGAASGLGSARLEPLVRPPPPGTAPRQGETFPGETEAGRAQSRGSFCLALLSESRRWEPSPARPLPPAPPRCTSWGRSRLF